MNENFRRLLPALGALALAHGAAAAPTLVVKRAPTGMTNAQLIQKLTPILAAQKQQQATRAQQVKTQMTNAFSTIEPERKALSAALADDPRYKAFLDQAQRISAGGGDAETKAAQMKALAGANRVIFDDAIRTSKINPITLQSKTGGLVTSGLSFKFKPVAPLKGALISSGSSGAPPPVPDLVLQPPFDYESTDTDNGGLAYSAAVASSDADNGKARMHSTIIGVAGGASGSALVGNTFNVPAGIKRIEVTITAKTSYAGSVLSALGVSFACTDTTLEVFSADFADRFAIDSDFQCVSALIGWFAEMSGDETSDHVFSINVPSDKRNMVVLADIYANASGGGVPGYADALSKAEITKVRVKFFNN